jgi:hypothetical protein
VFPHNPVIPGSNSSVPQMDHLLVLWPFASLGLGMMSMLNLCLKTWSSPEGASDVQSMRSWQRRTRDPQWWMQLALPIYLLHQWEEHGFDLLGRRYSFQGYFCEKLVSSLRSERQFAITRKLTEMVWCSRISKTSPTVLSPLW